MLLQPSLRGCFLLITVSFGIEWKGKVSWIIHRVVLLQPELHGILPVEHGNFQSLQRDAVAWPKMLKKAVAVCNALTLVKKNEVVGDLAEKVAFKRLEARFLVSSAPLPLPANCQRKESQAYWHHDSGCVLSPILVC